MFLLNVGNAIRNGKGRVQNKVKENKYFIFRRKQMVKYPTTKFPTRPLQTATVKRPGAGKLGKFFNLQSKKKIILRNNPAIVHLKISWLSKRRRFIIAIILLNRI